MIYPPYKTSISPWVSVSILTGASKVRNMRGKPNFVNSASVIALLSIVGVMVLMSAFVAGNFIYGEAASGVAREIPSIPGSHINMDLSSDGDLSLGFSATDDKSIDLIIVIS